MAAALLSIPDGTWISDIAIDMADVMLSTAAELHRVLSDRAEHRVVAWGPVWKLG